ncbi:MAG: tetratricopeptide repeat protein [Deltaproteobacteria bacterium]|nr:tetratricopeptide repeat protein [Deltaproteobacteria bacterium]
MKKILLTVLLFLSLMVCFTSPAGAGGLDDAKAGLAALNGRNYDEAIRLCNKAIESGELSQADLAITYYNRGLAWVHKGDADKAIVDFTKAIAINPMDGLAYYDRGCSWGKKGDNDKAFADYTKAIEINPKHASSYYNRGLIWYDKGNYDRAIADFTRVIEINPKHANAYDARSYCWEAKGEYDKADADYDKADELMK